MPMVRELSADFEDLATTTVPVERLLYSLDFGLSKVWWCTKLILPETGIRHLPTGVGGPRLLINEYQSWPAPYRHDEDAWLDVKGAFELGGVLRQPKDPSTRAQRLHDTGEA